MTGLVANACLAVLPLAAINWHTFFFMLFAAVACGGGLAVVFADNVVRMALYLVMSLGAVAGLFFLAGAEFVGAMQLMIYVGGTLVLLVFGVMLTAQAPFVSIRSTAGDKVLAGVAGVAVLLLLLQATFSVAEWGRPASGRVAPPAATPIGMALLGLRVDAPADAAGPAPAGYLLPFEIVSVHLLVVLVGAAYLARAKRRKTPRSIDVAASQEPPASVAEHAAVGRVAGASSVLTGGRS
jgi:NADH:ubiquinone oxidoreductase subunit 6 (subunit J)